MTLVLLNYADPTYHPYQVINSVTGALFGCDRVVSYGPTDIDASFYSLHEELLRSERGAGLWLWKPYFLATTLGNMKEDDVLLYSDAGMHFVDQLAPLEALMSERGLDLLVLGEGYSEGAYTRRDAFSLMDADQPQFVHSPQRFASAFLLRNNAWGRDFANQYLTYCCDSRILADGSNRNGADNYPGFVAHRHDQSVFSLLTKKLAVPCLALDLIAEGLAKPAGQVINHTRGKFAPGVVLTFLLRQGILNKETFAELSSSGS